MIFRLILYKTGEEKIFQHLLIAITTSIVFFTGTTQSQNRDLLSNETGDTHAESSWVSDGAQGVALPVKKCQILKHDDLFLSPGSILSSEAFVSPVTVTADGKQSLAIMKIRCDLKSGDYKVFENKPLFGPTNQLGSVHVLSREEQYSIKGTEKNLTTVRTKTLVKVKPCETLKRVYSFTDFPMGPGFGSTLKSEIFQKYPPVWDGSNSGIALLKIKCNSKPGLYDVRAISAGQNYSGSGSGFLVEKFQVLKDSVNKDSEPVKSNTVKINTQSKSSISFSSFLITLGVLLIFISALIFFISSKRKNRNNY